MTSAERYRARKQAVIAAFPLARVHLGDSIRCLSHRGKVSGSLFVWGFDQASYTLELRNYNTIDIDAIGPTCLTFSGEEIHTLCSISLRNPVGTPTALLLPCTDPTYNPTDQNQNQEVQSLV